MHVKKEEMEEEDLEKFFNVAAWYNKSRGPRRPANKTGIPLKWCPICKFVTPHLRKHLANKHKMKEGGYMDNCLKVARGYQGKDEVEDLPLLTVKQEPATTMSSTATETAASPVPKSEDSNPSYASEPEDEEYKDEEDDEYALQEEFFKNPNPKTIRHEWLVLFYRWLNTADAGRKKTGIASSTRLT